MNSLYELGVTVFRASTKDAQNFQHKILKDEINKLLLAKNDQYIQDAIRQAYKEDKVAVAHLIEEQCYCIINTICDVNHIHTLRSDFFILPLVIEHKHEQISLPALGTIESYLQNLMFKHHLITAQSKVVLAPMLLGYNTSLSMTPSKWYDLHQQIISKMDKRDMRKMFSHNFSINVEPHFPTLSFIVGTVVQYGGEFLHSQPLLFKHDYYSHKLQQNCLKDFQNTLDKHIEQLNMPATVVTQPNKQTTKQSKKFLKSAIVEKIISKSECDFSSLVLFHKPQEVLLALDEGYTYQQKVLAKLFVKKYEFNQDIEYSIISLDKAEHIVLFAWDKHHNVIDNYLLIEPFSHSMQDNIDMIMNFVALTNKNMYIGNSVLDSSVLQNYKIFDFKEYMEEQGVTVLESAEIFD